MEALELGAARDQRVHDAESELSRKYGAIKPKPKLIQKDHKFFDSADWALEQEGKHDAAVSACNNCAEGHLPVPTPLTAHRPLGPRRSHLAASGLRPASAQP